MPSLPDPNKYNDPIKYFRDCHALIAIQLSHLEQLTIDAEKKGIKKSIQEDKAWRDLFEFLVNVAPIHEQDEELALFPIVLQKIPHVGFQQVSSPMRFIHEQHEMMEKHSIELLRIWRQTLAMNELSDDDANRFIIGAKELAAIYREHVRRENEVIYTTANDELLSPTERQEILEVIRELHSKEVMTAYFDYEAPVFSDSSYKPVYVAEEEVGDAVSENEFEVEEEDEDTEEE